MKFCLIFKNFFPLKAYDKIRPNIGCAPHHTRFHHPCKGIRASTRVIQRALMQLPQFSTMLTKKSKYLRRHYSVQHSKQLAEVDYAFMTKVFLFTRYVLTALHQPLSLYP